jgi:Tfp pilus assembly protein PilZ
LQEKRKHPRIKEKLVVVCEAPEGTKLEQAAESEDLSAGGIRIFIPKKMVKGETVVLKINLFHDEIPIHAKGKVVWQKDAGSAGLEFSGLGPEEERRLKDYLRKKIKRPK